MFPLFCCHLTFYRVASILPIFCIHPNIHCPFSAAWITILVFVCKVLPNGVQKQYLSEKEKTSVYIFIWFRSWKSRKKGMLMMRGTHTLLSPRIVFMLPFEDLLHLGIVSPPSSRAWIRAVCPWRLLLVNSCPPTLLITASGEDELVKNQKHWKCQKYAFPCDILMRLQLMVIKKFPTLEKKRGLC